MSETFVDAGAHFISVDFNNAPEVDGNLMVMADQVRHAVAWVYKNAASFGGDPNRLYISGTSSGAHLAAVALTTDWKNDFGLPADILQGGLCCSGMYDLHPVSLSALRLLALKRPAGPPATTSRILAGSSQRGISSSGSAPRTRVVVSPCPRSSAARRLTAAYMASRPQPQSG